MKHSLSSGAGYLLIDHRNSPGLTEADVAHVPGAIAVGKGQVYETAMLTCSHCQAGVVLHPLRTRPRSYCAKCDHYICDSPICNASCTPIAQLFDAAFAGLPHNLGEL